MALSPPAITLSCCCSDDFVRGIASPLGSPSRPSADLVLLEERMPVSQPVQTLRFTADPVYTFEATLVRTSVDEPWGVLIEKHKQLGVHIGNVQTDEVDRASVVPQYNASVGADNRICPGDLVVSANGMSSQPDIYREFKDALILTLRLRRPRIFEQRVCKPKGAPMGLSLTHTQDGAVLYVKSIDETSALRDCFADVAVGDRIIRVNGRSGKPAELVDEMTEGDAVVLTISRTAMIGFGALHA